MLYTCSFPSFATMTDILSPCSDIVFKMLFGDIHNLDILKPFLQAVLPLPDDDYDEITLLNPFLFSDAPDNKTSILDIKAKTKTGRLLDIEIQVANHTAMRSRIVYYTARMITEQLGEGESYGEIKPSICVLITDFVLLPENRRYYNDYRLCNTETGEAFSDLMEIHTLELPKLPQGTDNTPQWSWLRFLKAKNREELEMLAEQHAEVKTAVAKLVRLSASDEARMRYEARLKAERDSITREKCAREEGREEGLLMVARNLLKQGLSVADIAAATGLSPEAVRALQDS
jgi:predicted transposase/invertase (TIGR01784 family)